MALATRVGIKSEEMSLSEQTMTQVGLDLLPLGAYLRHLL